MWWAGSKACDLYLGTRAVAIGNDTDEAIATSTDGFEAGMLWAQSQHKEKDHSSRLRVWLSGGLCRPFLLPDLAGISGEAEIARVASRLANERTGFPGACRVWLDAAKRGEPRVAIAVEEETIGRLESGLGSRWRIVSIQPWWAEVLRVALLRKEAPLALGVQDCDSLTILVGRNGGFESATTISPILDEASANAAFARARLSAKVEWGQEVLGRLKLGGALVSGPSRCALGALMELRR